MSQIKRMTRLTLQKEIYHLKIKGIVYKSCVRSAMLYGSEIWCLGQNEIGILQRTERAMVRNMYGLILMDKKSTKDLMQNFDFGETVDQLAKANGVRWHGYELKKKNYLRGALDFEVKGTRKRGKEKKTCVKAVPEQTTTLWPHFRSANKRSRLRLWVNTISIMMR